MGIKENMESDQATTGKVVIVFFAVTIGLMALYQFWDLLPFGGR